MYKTKSDERNEIIRDAEKTIGDYEKLIIRNANKINDSIKAKNSTIKNPLDICLIYSMQFVQLQKEIMQLQKSNMHLCLLPLTRVALECYSVFKTISTILKKKCFDALELNKCIETIAYNSIQQEMSEFSSLDTGAQNSRIGQSYIEGLTAEITEVFGTSVLVVDSSGNTDLNATLKQIKQGRPYLKNEKISNRVRTALLNNPLISSQLSTGEISYVYPNLSKSAHCNISSVVENTTQVFDGSKVKAFMTENKNSVVYLGICYNCLCDLFNDLELLLSSEKSSIR